MMATAVSPPSTPWAATAPITPWPTQARVSSRTVAFGYLAIIAPNGGTKALTYDANGSLLDDGPHHYTYNAAGRLSQADHTRYAYNGLGQRVSKRGPARAGGLSPWVVQRLHRGHDHDGDGDDFLHFNRRTTFAYGRHGQLLGAYHAGFRRQETLWMGRTPVAVLTAFGLYAIHSDQLNSPRKITGFFHHTVWHWPVSGFGARQPSGWLHYAGRFPGQYHDRETGLNYNDHRYYDPAIGRYVQSDPIGLAGGLNPYAYVNNNPLIASDSSGEYFVVDDLAFTATGAIVGVAGQGLSDLIAGHLSSPEAYAGAAIGGAVGGETALYLGPEGGGLVGGAATNLATQYLSYANGKQSGFNASSLAIDTVVGAATGFIPELRVQGISAGRGSYRQIYKQIVTKARNGTISRVRPKTALKMAVGNTVSDLPGFGAGAAAAASGLLPPTIPANGPSCRTP